MVIEILPKKYRPKKGQFGYSVPNYEKELARVSSNTKAKTAQQKASLRGAKIFYNKKLTAVSGKSRKKRRTRRKSRGKSRRKSRGKSRTKK